MLVLISHTARCVYTVYTVSNRAAVVVGVNWHRPPGGRLAHDRHRHRADRTRRVHRRL